MRKWVLIVLVAAACSRAPSMGSSLAGAATPREAATLFMGAVKSQDLQAMSSVWGNAEGPSRDNIERNELDRRLVLFQQCYDHDRFEILDETIVSPTARTVRVQVTRGTRTKIPHFKVVRGPSNRWFIEDLDFPAVQSDFCARPD
ncbi:MAG: hypothetical protein HUU26_09230 [Gemmatimonadaceae bacterium]|nr:hypothetical protein [Gemmatimonadaceae bacterium]